MAKTLSIASLKAMSPKRQQQRLAQIAEDTRRLPNGELKTIAERLEKYERDAGFSSEEMLGRVNRGDLQENDTIASWMMLLDLKSRVGARSR